jgi:hypothetical protein
MENTSPKKYIQTKARSLPIYRCYINYDWEDGGLANVIVTRKHINNKITGGFFLVDLKCLGIKDTSWFFNIPEYELAERFPDFEEYFGEIEYPLAHNIIYAGHDFALEYDIAPHKDFVITRFILEEDDDKIPLIDIAVGDDGIPHLITHNRGEHKAALAKLMKNAGEGNYHYTISSDDFSENEEDEGSVDDVHNISLSSIKPGKLNPYVVQKVELEDLINVKLVNQRNEAEQAICQAEALIRMLDPALTKDEKNLIDKEWTYREEHDIDYTDQEIVFYQDLETLIGSTLKIDNQEVNNWQSDKKEDYLLFNQLMSHSTINPITVTLLNIIDLTIDYENPNELVLEKMNNLVQHDIIQLSLALREILTNYKEGRYRSIVEQSAYESNFSGKTENFHEDCLALYYLIQVIRNSQLKNVGLAIEYYHLLSAHYECVAFTFGGALLYPIFLNTLYNEVKLTLINNETT